MAGKLLLDWSGDNAASKNPTRRNPTGPEGLAKAVVNSGNRKVGISFGTYASQASCPDGVNTAYRCPLYGDGCYAEENVFNGAGKQTKELNEAAGLKGHNAGSSSFTPEQIAEDEAAAIRAAIPEWKKTRKNNWMRLHVVGDCVTKKAARILSDAADECVASAPGDAKNIWNYTHAWRTVPRSEWSSNISMLGSCDVIEDIPKAYAKGYAPAIVMGDDFMREAGEKQNREFGKAFKLPNGFNILPCPHEIAKIATPDEEPKQCIDCKWCMREGWLRNGKFVIAFAAHTKKSKVVVSKLITISADDTTETTRNPCRGGGRGSLQNPSSGTLLYITPHKGYADELSAHLWKYHGIRNTILHHARDNNYEVVLLHPDNDYREAKKVVADFMDEKAHMRSWLDEETAKESNPTRTYHTSATTLPDATRLKKFGKWEVGTYRHHDGTRRLYVTDGWVTDYPTDYGDGRVAYDRPEAIPASVKTYVQSQVRRRNPEDTAAEMYETFHGKPSEEILEVGETVRFHENLAVLGELVEFKIATLTKKDAEISFADSGCVLCSNEKGTQLYVVGGDQSLDLEKLGFKGDQLDKDMITVGVLYELTYQTAKGFDKFKLTDYYHELGEDTGFQPMVVYDRLNDFILVSGGEYKIKAEGITN